MNQPLTYRDAGVSIDRANQAKERIKKLARGTFNERTLSEIGSFGGMFSGAFPEMSAPVLVASADGVGTKLKIAFATNKHDTVGRDLVNHCTNDILVQGARPLFFLDYIATGVLAPDVVAEIVAGVAGGAAKTVVCCSAARRRRCPASTAKANTMWPASFLASSIASA